MKKTDLHRELFELMLTSIDAINARLRTQAFTLKKELVLYAEENQGVDPEKFEKAHYVLTDEESGFALTISFEMDHTLDTGEETPPASELN